MAAKKSKKKQFTSSKSKVKSRPASRTTSKSGASKPKIKSSKSRSKPKTSSKPSGKAAKHSAAPVKKHSRNGTAPLRAKRPNTKVKRPKTAKVVRPRALPPEDPIALALARTIAGVATEKKALDVVIIDVRARGHAVGYDYIVVASAESDRQLSSIADAMTDKLKPEGRRALGVETSADWVLADYDEVIAHLLTPDRRAELDIEGQWSDAPRISVSG